MKARFVGDPGDNFSGPDLIEVWGETFVKGEWQEVKSDRFATHSHFEIARPTGKKHEKGAEA